MRDSIALAVFSGVSFLLAVGFLMVDMRGACQVFAIGAIISLNGSFICSAIEKRY